MKKVTLPHNHEHAGKMYKAGEEIELTSEQYAWLMGAVVSMRANDNAAKAEVVGTPEWADKQIALSEKKKKAK